MDPAEQSSVAIIRDLGVADVEESWAQAVNRHGYVVGGVQDRSGFEQAVLWAPGGIPQVLDDLGGNLSQAYAINGEGVIVGESRREALPASIAVRWHAETPERITVLKGSQAEAFGINASGVIVGRATLGPDRHERAVRWDADNQCVDLGHLPGYETANYCAHAVSDRGEIVGELTFGVADRLPFVVRDGVMSDPNDGLSAAGEGGLRYLRAVSMDGVLAGAVVAGGKMLAALMHPGPSARLEVLGALGEGRALCFGINDFGHAVGMSESDAGDCRAFLAAHGALLDLNQFLPAGSAWHLVRAEDLNEDGWIVGHGVYAGRRRAFAMRVEPAALKAAAQAATAEA